MKEVVMTNIPTRNMSLFCTPPSSPSTKESSMRESPLEAFSPTSQLEKMLLGKKLGSMKKLTKKGKVVSNADPEHSHYECLLGVREISEGGFSPTTTTPTGTFVVYVGGERQRFAVPTSYLSHPLFKILLNKASNEFGFDQRNGLVVPCSVNAFQEVINAVECCNGRFDFGDLVDEFL